MKPYPPLGLLCISAYFKKKGVAHEVFDSTFSSFEKLCARLISVKPKQVAVYTNLVTKLNVLKLIRFIRGTPDLKDCWIILGGPDVRHNAENYLEQGADALVIGEGEETLEELIATLNTPFNPFLDKVEGIAFRNYFGKVVVNPERRLLKNVDELPAPNREAIDLQPYLDTWKRRHGKSALSISTQRGCPYTCKWCSTAVYGQTYRRRSPALVCDEIEEIIARYHPDSLWFVDDVFTVSHKWLKEFTAEIRKRNIRIPFECITRADRMSEEVIADLKLAGCFRVWIGAESGSQNVIDRMDRRVNVNHVRDMIIRAKAMGIETGTFIMLGYPGETEADIMATVDHLVASDPDQFTITIAYPIAGTGLYNEVKEAFVHPPEWATSTDRELDFTRTYSRKYYDYAVRFVVNAVKYRTMPLWKRFLHPRAWIYFFKSMAAQEGMQRHKKTAP